jgi:AAA+ superfamily predicted ATPase
LESIQKEKINNIYFFNIDMENVDFISKLIKIKRQLNLISDKQINYLKSYLTSDGFFSVPYIASEKIDEKIYESSIKYGRLSTCFALISLLKSSLTINEIEKQLQRKNIFKDFIDKLLNEPSGWMNTHSVESYDPFSTPFRLLLLKMVKDEIHIDKIGFDNQYIRQAINSIVKSLTENNYYFSNHGKRNPSAFITYYSLEALYEWYDEIVKLSNLDESFSIENRKLLDNITSIFQNVFLWAQDKLFQQIAYYSANDLDKKDPYLAFYCMFIYKKYNTIYKNKLSYPNQDYNKYVIKKIIDCLLGEKNSIENIWEKNDLIISTNTVSIYTFSLSTLAEFFSVMDPDEYENYYIVSVEKILQWITTNEKKGESLQISSSPTNRVGSYFGWLPVFIKREFEINESIPYCYSTSLVFGAILNLQNSLNKILTPKIILDEFQGDFRNVPSINNFNKLMDTVIHQGNGTTASVKKIIYKSILLPRLINKRGLENLPNSICLFGPPGTGKTTIASTISEVLGWSFIRIEPSAFVKDGMDKFAQRVAYVFDCLKQLDKTVILFDEMDEYIKKRVIESDQDSKSSPDFFNRLSTNIFLTEIDKLYKSNKNIIYLIATNNINDIDEAITRDDRIDFKIFIDFIYPKELIGMLEERIEELIKTEKNTKLEIYFSQDNGYKSLKKNIENELFLKNINYKKWVRFVNNFIRMIKNGDIDENDIINEIKQGFSDIDYKYLELRKEQHKKNRVDTSIIKDSIYGGYKEFTIEFKTIKTITYN